MDKEEIMHSVNKLNALFNEFMDLNFPGGVNPHVVINFLAIQSAGIIDDGLIDEMDFSIAINKLVKGFKQGQIIKRLEN